MIYVVEGFDPTDYESESKPVKAFYDEDKAKIFCDEMSKKSRHLEVELAKLYSYLDDEFPLTGQDSISQRVEYLKTTNVLQEISDKYFDVPVGCKEFDYYELDIE